MRIISNQSRKSNRAFTLIEMIGVLAVIAILASMLIPKIFEAINSARINNTVQSYNAIKTAVMDHYGKYGAINFVGVPAPGHAAAGTELSRFDRDTLLVEGLIDKTFAARVGTNWLIQATPVGGAITNTTAVTGTNEAYDLDGQGLANDAFPAAFVVEAVIEGVAVADAIEISERLDGVPLSVPAGGQDIIGRVKYAGGSVTDVRIYIAHR